MLAHWLPMASIVFSIMRICHSLFKRNYLKNEKFFLNFMFLFWNLHQIFKIFLKNIIVIANIFPKPETVKNLVRPLSKKHGFRTSFQSQHVKGFQTLVISTWEHLYHVFLSLWEEKIWKISPLLKFKILGVFVNTLTAGDEHPVQNCDNFQFLIQRIS